MNIFAHDFSALGDLLALLNLLRQDTNATDDVAVLVENLTLVVQLLASAVRELALNKLANRVAVLVEHLALLVDLQAVQDVETRNVLLRALKISEAVAQLLSRLLCSVARDNLDLTDDLAVLIEDLSLVVDCLTGGLLDVALGELTDLITLLIEDLALLVDL